MYVDKILQWKYWCSKFLFFKVIEGSNGSVMYDNHNVMAEQFLSRSGGSS